MARGLPLAVVLALALATPVAAACAMPPPRVALDVPGPGGEELLSIHVQGECPPSYEKELWVRVLGLDVLAAYGKVWRALWHTVGGALPDL